MSSQDYIGKPYKRGIGWLSAGDRVIVHPTETSALKEKYEADVVFENGELGTMIEGGHFSIMRDYLFDRLEKIK